jgi:hypothetical protein
MRATKFFSLFLLFAWAVCTGDLVGRHIYMSGLLPLEGSKTTTSEWSLDSPPTNQTVHTQIHTNTNSHDIVTPHTVGPEISRLKSTHCH